MNDNMIAGILVVTTVILNILFYYLGKTHQKRFYQSKKLEKMRKWSHVTSGQMPLVMHNAQTYKVLLKLHSIAFDIAESEE